MPALILWLIYLCISLILIAVAALTAQPSLYLVTSAVICSIGALIGLQSLWKLDANKSSQSHLSSITALTIGIFWIWGAFSLLLTYYFFLPPWREWGTFCATFGLIAATCFYYSWIMKTDAQKWKEDAALLKIGRYLTVVQLIGTVLAMLGLLIDPQKSFMEIQKRDWAANNIFFFGALELAVVSGAALLLSRTKKN